MAVAKYGNIITDLNGSIGGNTYQSNHGVKTVRSKISPVLKSSQARDSAFQIIFWGQKIWRGFTSATRKAIIQNSAAVPMHSVRTGGQRLRPLDYWQFQNHFYYRCGSRRSAFVVWQHCNIVFSFPVFSIATNHAFMRITPTNPGASIMSMVLYLSKPYTARKSVNVVDYFYFAANGSNPNNAQWNPNFTNNGFKGIPIVAGTVLYYKLYIKRRDFDEAPICFSGTLISP